MDIFLSDLVMDLPENIGINEHAIELKEGKQLPYESIFALSLVELKTLKAYMKTHPKTRFMWPSKSPAGTSILYNKMPDSSFCICVDY